MYINVQTIITASSLLTALGALIGAIIAVYKQIELNQQQNQIINSIQEEQKIICKGLRGALEGLIEQGCDGPCKDALALLNEHLDDRSHNTPLKGSG